MFGHPLPWGTIYFIFCVGAKTVCMAEGDDTEILWPIAMPQSCSATAQSRW